jgi:phosphoribosylamine--glycine ligase
MTVIGPEQPLVDGLVNYLEERGHPVFGPTREAARLEGSKDFAKAFMQRHGIPTAAYRTYVRGEWDMAEEYLRQHEEGPVVLKADGLAGGKGVFVCANRREAIDRLRMMGEEPSLGQAAASVVIEEFLEGEEISVFAISDGLHVKILSHARDFKRIGEGDTGLNTGGMGAITPVPGINNELLEQILIEIIEPTIRGMAAEGNPYRGLLYCGLMLTAEGPKVVEYNCRFGDPETQVILPHLETDLFQLMLLTETRELDKIRIRHTPEAYACVVVASEGYPQAYEKGRVIRGFDLLDEETLVFHSGTAMRDREVVTDGGRVLSVVASGRTLEAALKEVYREVEKIRFEGRYFRRDIGRVTR